MALVTPTTAELRDNIVAAIESQIAQTVPLLPKSFTRALSLAVAATLTVLYKYSGFNFLQMFVATASFSETTINGVSLVPLVEWGRLIGVGDPTTATAAEVSTTINVNTGATIPAGTQFLHAPSGVVYATVASNVLTTPTTTVTVRAVSDPTTNTGQGTVGNREPGDVLSAVNPNGAFQEDTVVVLTDVFGEDAETETAYRQRVKDYFAFRPQGGAYADYRTWSIEVPEIDAAYPYTSDDPGEVNVYCQSTTEVDGIPTPAQLQAVKDSIELDDAGLATRRPANAFVNVLPITRTGFDVTINDLDVNDPTQVQTDVQTALNEYFLARQPFVLGVTLPPRTDQIANSAVSGVVEDIVTNAGGTFSSVATEVSGGGGGVVNYGLGEGEKAKLVNLTVNLAP